MDWFFANGSRLPRGTAVDLTLTFALLEGLSGFLFVDRLRFLLLMFLLSSTSLAFSLSGSSKSSVENKLRTLGLGLVGFLPSSPFLRPFLSPLDPRTTFIFLLNSERSPSLGGARLVTFAGEGLAVLLFELTLVVFGRGVAEEEGRGVVEGRALSGSSELFLLLGWPDSGFVGWVCLALWPVALRVGLGAGVLGLAGRGDPDPAFKATFGVLQGDFAPVVLEVARNFSKSASQLESFGI